MDHEDEGTSAGSLSLVSVHPSGSFIACTYGPYLIVFDTSSFEEVQASDLQDQGHKALIRDVKFDRQGQYLATVSDDKTLKIWSCSSWTQLSSRTLAKKPTSVEFSADSRTAVVADKFGEIHCFFVSDLTKESSVLLGHLSLVTDVRISPAGDFVITCDRDEKIRVTCFPETYQIHAYCLGHTQFVTCLAIPPWSPAPLLLSGAGDGTLRLWNYHTGALLDSFHVASHGTKAASDPRQYRERLAWVEEPTVSAIAACPLSRTVAVLVEGLRQVDLFSLSASPLAPKLHHLGTCPLDHLPSDVAFDPAGHMVLSTDRPSLIFLSPAPSLAQQGATGVPPYLVVEDHPGARAVSAALQRAKDTLGEVSQTLDQSQLRKKAPTDDRPSKRPKPVS